MGNTMSKHNPVIFGEVLFDCFEDGSRVLGGAPFNVAWHLQAFGCDPLFISRVGDDPLGDEIKSTMQQWGMVTDGLQTDSDYPTGEVKVTLDQGQPAYEIVIDSAYDHIQAVEIPVSAHSLLYHGSLALRMKDSAKTLHHCLKQQPVFMDINLRPPWWNKEQLQQLLTHVNWLKINDEELAELISTSSDLKRDAYSLLQHYQLEILIVTCGAKGAFAMDSAGKLYETAPAKAVKVIDTVGAGDAFAAVCILGILRNWPVSVMMQRAQQFASVLVGNRGATINDPSLYQSLLTQWQ
jgi:fructokinase